MAETSSTDLTQQITQAAASPAAASSDGQSVTARSVSELIEADQYVKNQQRTGRGLPFRVLKGKGNSCI